jgi:tape measure domain-containing protein
MDNGVILDVDSDSRKARSDLEQLNRALSRVFANANLTGQSLDKVGSKPLDTTVKDARRLDQSFKQLRGTGRDTFTKPDSDLRSLNNQMQTMGRLIKTAVAGFVAFTSVSSFNKAADDLTNLNNRLRLVSRNMDEVNAKFRANQRIAKDARADTATAVNLYTTLQRSLSRSVPAINNSELERLTSTLLKSSALSGSAAESARAAMIQLQQGLASGVLRGEEFNSVMEQLPYLGDLLARSFNVSIGELRKLAAEGKITSDSLTKNLLRMSDTVDADFKRTTLTAGAAASVFKERLAQTFGELNLQLGTSATFARRLDHWTDGLDRVTTRMIGGFVRMRSTVATLKTDIRNITDMQIAARLFLDTPLSVSQIAKTYSVLKLARENVASLRDTYLDARAKMAKSSIKLGDQFGDLDNVSSKDVAEMDASLAGGLKETVKSTAKLLGDITSGLFTAVTLSFENTVANLGKIYTPLYLAVDVVAAGVKKSLAELQEKGEYALVPFYRRLQAINEYFRFWERNTNVERAWSRMFQSRSLIEFRDNLDNLNKQRAKGPGQNWLIWVRDLGVYFGQTNKALENFLIRFKILPQRPKIEWDFFRDDRIVQSAEVLLASILRVYEDNLAPTIRALFRIARAEVELQVRTLASIFTETFTYELGRSLGASFAGIARVMSAWLAKIFAFASSGFKAELSLEIVFNSAPVLTVRRFLRQIQSFVAGFVAALTESLNIDRIFDRLVGGVQSAVGALQHTLGALKTSLRDAFNITSPQFSTMISQIYTVAVSGLRKTIDVVAEFARRVGLHFYDLYIAVVGNSYWPDLIDGVYAYAQNLRGTERRVDTFADKVSSAFAGIRVHLPDFLQPLIDRFAKIGSFLANLDFGGTLKMLTDNLGAILLGAWVLSWESVAAKFSAMAYFAGLLSTPGDAGTNLLTQSLQAFGAYSDGVVKTFMRNLARGIIVFINAIFENLPEAIFGALEAIPIIGKSLSAALYGITAGGNAILMTAIAGLAIYITKMKSVAAAAQGLKTMLWASPLQRMSTTTGAGASIGLPGSGRLLSGAGEIGVGIAAVIAASFLDSVSLIEGAIFSGLAVLISRLGGQTTYRLFERVFDDFSDSVISKFAKGFKPFKWAEGTDIFAETLGKWFQPPKVDFLSNADRTITGALLRMRKSIAANLSGYAEGTLSFTEMLFGTGRQGNFDKARFTRAFRELFSNMTSGFQSASQGGGGIVAAFSKLWTEGLLGPIGNFSVNAKSMVASAVASISTGLSNLRRPLELLAASIIKYRVAWGMVFVALAGWANASENAISGTVTELGKLIALGVGILALAKSFAVLRASFGAYQTAVAAFDRDAFNRIWAGMQPEVDKRKAELIATLGNREGRVAASRETAAMREQARAQAAAAPGRTAAGMSAVNALLVAEFSKLGNVFNKIGSGIIAAISIAAAPVRLLLGVIAGAFVGGGRAAGGALDILQGVMANKRSGRSAFARDDGQGVLTPLGLALGSLGGGQGRAEAVGSNTKKVISDLARDIGLLMGGLLQGLLGLVTGLATALLSIVQILGRSLGALLAPFVKIGAIIAAVVGGAGALYVAIFGEGETFFEKLRYTYDQLRAIVGLAPTGGVKRGKDLLGEIPSQMIGNVLVDVSYAQRAVDLGGLTSKEYGYLQDLQKTLQEQIDSARREEFLQGKITTATEEALRKAAEDFSRAVGRLPTKDDMTGGPLARLLNDSWLDNRNSGWSRFARMTGSARDAEAPENEEASRKRGLVGGAQDLANWYIDGTRGTLLDFDLTARQLEHMVTTSFGAISGWISDIGRVSLPETLQQIKQTLTALDKDFGEITAFLPESTRNALAERVDLAREMQFLTSQALDPKVSDRKLRTLASGVANEGIQRRLLGLSAEDVLDFSEGELDAKFQELIGSLSAKGIQDLFLDSFIGVGRELEGELIRLIPIGRVTKMYQEFEEARRNTAERLSGSLGIDFGGDNFDQFVSATPLMEEYSAQIAKAKLELAGMGSELEALNDYDRGVFEDRLVDMIRLQALAAEEWNRTLASRFSESYFGAIEGLTADLGIDRMGLENIFSKMPTEELEAFKALLDAIQTKKAEINKAPAGSARWKEARAELHSLQRELVNYQQTLGTFDALSAKGGLAGVSGFDDISRLRFLGDDVIAQYESQMNAVLGKQEEIRKKTAAGLSADANALTRELFGMQTSLNEALQATFLNLVNNSDGVYSQAAQLSRLFGVEIPAEIGKNPVKLAEWVGLQTELVRLTLALKLVMRDATLSAEDLATKMTEILGGIDGVNKSLSGISKTISSSDLLGVNIDIGFEVDERSRAAAMDSIRSDLMELRSLREARSENNLSNSGLAASFARETAIMRTLQTKLSRTMFNTGAKMYAALSEVGISSYEQIARAGLGSFAPLLSNIAELRKLRWELDQVDPASGEAERIFARIAKLEKVTDRFARRTNQTLDAYIENINNAFGSSFDLSSAVFLSPGIRSAFGALALDIQDLFEDLGSGAASDSVGRAAVQIEGAMMALAATLERVAESARTAVSQFSFEAMSSAFSGNELFSQDAIFLSQASGDVQEQFNDLNNRRLIAEISALNNLPSEVALAINTWDGRDTGQLMQDLQSVSEGFLDDLMSTPLGENTTALRELTAAIRGNYPSVSGAADSSKLPTVSTGVVKNLAEQQRAAILATFESLRDQMQGMPERLRVGRLGALTGTSLDMRRIDPESSKRLDQMLGNLFQIQATIRAGLVMGEDVTELEQEAYNLESAVDGYLEVFVEGARVAGENLASSTKSAFEQGLASLLKGEKGSKEVLESFLDTFTASIIDTFARGLTERLTEGPVEGLLKRLGEGVFSLGAGGKPSEDNPEASATGGEVAGSLLKSVTDGVKEGSGLIAEIFGEHGVLGLIGRGLSGIGGMFGTLLTNIMQSFNGLGGGGGGSAKSGLLSSLLGAAASFAMGSAFGNLGKTNIAPGVKAATGGLIVGAGTGTSDSIPAMLSNREFVVNAAQTKRFLPLLQAINAGRGLELATGGLVDTSSLLSTGGVNYSRIDSAVHSGASTQVVNVSVTGDISRQTKAEIYKMLPQIAQGVNSHNREKGQRR